VKVYLRTFGCRANHYDSESVRAMIEGAGHAVVSSAVDADVAIFNSCAVTADAEADVRQAIRRAAREQPRLRSIVMGCVATRAAKPNVTDVGALPTVQHVVPGAELESIAAALDLPPAMVRLRAARQTSARALLRVQDGCDEHCTFCATTLARGANRSRPVEELIAEAERLADTHPEIVITGIHIGSYGADIGSSLGVLLEALVSRVCSVRFRLSSLEASEVGERLADLLTGAPGRVAPHLHAPLQSGSDRMLKRMGRHWYTASSYASSIEALARRAGVLGLGADVITGFPGETEDDHRQTTALVERLPFTYLHVFPFSQRPGTAAERLDGRVSAEVAQRRAAELREVSRRKAEAHLASRIGGSADAVVVRSAGSTPEGVGEALTEDYLSALPGDAMLPRRARYQARLERRGDKLIAVKVV
jgi:threonylcarbamoyladenosine tRNA methylthiotransferase MtaB